MLWRRIRSLWRYQSVLLVLLLTTSSALAQSDTGNTRRVFLPIILGNGVTQTPPIDNGSGAEPINDLPPLLEATKSPWPIDVKLLAVEQRLMQEILSATSIPSLQASFANQGVTMSDNGMILIEILGPENGEATIAALLLSFGATGISRGTTLTAAWLPANQLSALAKSLPSGYFLARATQPGLDQVAGEGPTVTGSNGYIVNGVGTNCAGLTIAVIDSGFSNLTAARTNGDAPPLNITTQVTYVGGNFEGGASEHGTGVIESLFDHCPDAAAWRLYRVRNTPVDVITAVNDARTNNVDIISHSMSWYNQGMGDDTGQACAAIRQLGADQLFFTSAGNRAESHWQGALLDADGDQWHEWASGDETINITVPNNATVTFYLSWFRTSGTPDYDLYLYDAALTELDHNNNSGSAFEELTWTNSTGSEMTVHLSVHHYSGSTPEFELFMHDNVSSTWTQYPIATSSTTSPSNCISDRLIVVGAVDHDDYGDVAGISNIQTYSSQGPTNGGRIVPHLVGPTNVSAFSNDGEFGGTSAATPNAAGAAAAFWASVQNMSATGVAQLLRHQAGQFNDWGAVGVENTYGSGGIELFTYATNSSWVDRSIGNTGGNITLPYFYLSHAQTNTPANGRVVILSGSYPEPITLTKPMTYHSIGTAVLGQ